MGTSERKTSATDTKPTRAEAWAAVDRIRNEIGRKAGKLKSDSTADIRAGRDKDERHR